MPNLIFPGQDPEDARIVSELQATGPEGRPPTRADVTSAGEPSVVQRIGLALSDFAAGARGQALPSVQRKQQQLERSILKAKAPQILIETAKGFQDLGLNDEQAKKAAAFLSQSAGEIGFEVPPEVFSQAISNSDYLKALAVRFPEILSLPPSVRRNPKVILELIEEQKKTAEARRKFALEQGYTAEEAEQYVASGKLPTGATPKARGEMRKEDLSIAVKDELRAAGVDPKDATPDQIKKAKDAVDERLLQRAREQGAGAVQVKASKELTELEPILNIVESVKSFANQLITAKTGPEAIAQGARLHTGVISRTNALAAAYQEGRQAFLGVLARSLGGERGVLTDRDIKRVDGMLPGFFDTEEIKRIKLGLLDNAVDSAMNAKRKLAEGKTTPENARAEVTRRIDELMKKVPKSKAQFDSAEEVKAAFKRGQISKEEAGSILRDQFGFKE